ncbi:MAG: FAD-binding oxidoreductase [Thermoleophilia bacterium]|nr:FAD-binding oxidoreductase [Thermoleophilia bacterium]
MWDRRPALIAQCASVGDIVAALDFARANDLEVAVRGGGHSVPGYAVCEGGIVVDLRPMTGIWVDRERRVARVQPGVTWGDFDRETQLHGLATTGGRVSTTGISGHILGSGSGWLERKFGLAADNLLAADLVTAGGELVRASEDENADLFWGIRGGGGNFGVVTSFELRLHPVGPELLAGMVLHPAERAPELARFYRDFMHDAPDEVASGMAFATAPAAPFVPTVLHDRPAVAVYAAYVGDVEEGEEVLRPLREWGPPDADLIEPMPYTAFQTILDAGNAPGMHNYWWAENFREVGDEAIDTLVERAAAATSPLTQLLLFPLGGALARVPNDATALGGRDAPWQYHALAVWSDADESDVHIAWARDTAEALRPWTRPGIYLNYTSDDSEERVRETYGEGYERLVALKDKYDPRNVFCLNQNIKPSRDAAAHGPAAPRE